MANSIAVIFFTTETQDSTEDQIVAQRGRAASRAVGPGVLAPRRRRDYTWAQPCSIGMMGIAGREGSHLDRFVRHPSPKTAMGYPLS